MLDSVPRHMWIRYWLVRNWEHVVELCSWLLLPATVLSYWLLRPMLIDQQGKTTVHVSNLTVLYILFLLYVSYVANWAINKRFLATRHWTIRYAAWLGVLVLLLLFLKAIGFSLR